MSTNKTLVSALEMRATYDACEALKKHFRQQNVRWRHVDIYTGEDSRGPFGTWAQVNGQATVNDQSFKVQALVFFRSRHVTVQIRVTRNLNMNTLRDSDYYTYDIESSL